MSIGIYTKRQDKYIYIKKPDTSYSLNNLQKSVILESANLSRKVLSVKWKRKLKHLKI